MPAPKPPFMGLFNVFFYAPSLMYIALKQTNKNVKILTEIFAVVTLLYNGGKLLQGERTKI